MVLVLGPFTAAAKEPVGYGEYYRNQYYNRSDRPSTDPSVTRRLWNHYFYRNPAISPYANIGRRDTLRGDYQAYVRPEIDRRERAAQADSAYVRQRKLQGDVGRSNYGGRVTQPRTSHPSAGTTGRVAPSSYYNQWYGGWLNRR